MVFVHYIQYQTIIFYGHFTEAQTLNQYSLETLFRECIIISVGVHIKCLILIYRGLTKVSENFSQYKTLIFQNKTTTGITKGG